MRDRPFTLSPVTLTLVALAASLSVACGGSAPPPADAADVDDGAVPAGDDVITDTGEVGAAGPVGEAGDGGGVEVSGVYGTIPQHEVQRVMERHMDRLGECYGEALEVHESIEGQLEIVAEINLDGSVATAYLRRSDLGHLGAEESIVERVGRFSFPEPEGGRAEVSYPLVLDAPYDPPEPQRLTGKRVEDVIGENMADLERCLAGQTGVSVTAYVAQGGRVIAAGAAGGSAELYEAATCLAEAMTAWTFGDPGQQLAKVSIDL